MADRTWLPVVLLPATLLAACATSTQSGPASPDGYLSVTHDQIAFLQWTRSGGSLTGVATVAYLDSDNSVQTDTETFTGVIGGGSVTLTFSSNGMMASDYAPAVNGRIEGATLTFTYPDPNRNGALVAARFTGATAGGYNSALARLQARGRQAQHAAAVATATAVATARTSMCAVQDSEGDNAITATGPSRRAVCAALVNMRGSSMSSVDPVSVISSNNYQVNCTVKYRGDTVRAYANTGIMGDPTWNNPCPALRRGRLPTL